MARVWPTIWLYHTYELQDRRGRVVGARAIESYIYLSFIYCCCMWEYWPQAINFFYILSPNLLVNICPSSIQFNDIFYIDVTFFAHVSSETKLLSWIINSLHQWHYLVSFCPVSAKKLNLCWLMHIFYTMRPLNKGQKCSCSKQNKKLMVQSVEVHDS